MSKTRIVYDKYKFYKNEVVCLKDNPKTLYLVDRAVGLGTGNVNLYRLAPVLTKVESFHHTELKRV